MNIPGYWALDFVRAMRERSRLMRWLFRLAAGKYAYREFVGLVLCLDNSGFAPEWGYGLENCEYHNKKLPLDWVDSLRGEK